MIPRWLYGQGCLVVLLISATDVFCAGAYKVRISPTFGNVQVYDNNEWKDLTVPYLGIREQKVLCRQLGQPADWTHSHEPGFRSSNYVSLDITCIGNETSLSQCPVVSESWPQHAGRKMFLSCEGLTFELQHGNKTDGLLIVQNPVQYYPVCVDGLFDGTMAKTVCEILGFSSSNALVMYPNMYRSSITRAVKLKLTCSENETDCEFHTTNTNEFCEVSSGISYLNIGAVFCKDKPLEYRLTNPDNDPIQRLEVKITDTWGPVCNGAEDDSFAQMACNAMGLPGTDVRTYEGLYSGGDFDRKALNLKYCIPWTESGSPGICRFSMIGQPCDNQGYLALSCANATEGQIRLVTHDSGTESGTLQVYHNDEWLGIGVNSSNASALHLATVACRSLNMSTNGVNVTIRKATVKLWLNSVRCTGEESNISNCSGASLDLVENKTEGHLLDVSCGTLDDAVRLESDGLLMMRRNGRWGTVCSSTFTNLDAAVICNALNKSSSLATASRGSNKPKRTGTLWLDIFQCNSLDDDWRNCRRSNFWENRGCTHDDDVYISCGSFDPSSVEYRLSKSPVHGVGVLEVRINNTWGGVCNYHFTNREAKVACRSLKLRTDGVKVINSRLFTKTQRNKMWLAGLNCSGTEASILDCQHHYFGDDPCSGYFEAPAAVYCGAPYTTDDFSLRLIGESDTKPSRVEVSLFGEWGTICDQKFSENDAKAICSQLDIGLPSMFASVASKGTYQRGTGRIWLTNTSCDLYVGGLRGCSFDLADGSCDHSQDVGVVCGTIPAIPTFTPNFNYPVTRHWVITGASVGAAGFVFILGLIVALLRYRVWRSSGRAIPVTQANQYVTPSSAGFSTGYDYTPPAQSNKY